MSRRVLAVIGLTALALLAPALQADAIRKHTRDTRAFCSKTGDYCVAIRRASSSPRFDLASFAFDGGYQLCVAGPDRVQVCRDFVLQRKPHGIFRSRVAWRANFPVEPGRHSVTWIKDGTRLGPTLHFTPFRVCSECVPPPPVP